MNSSLGILKDQIKLTNYFTKKSFLIGIGIFTIFISSTGFLYSQNDDANDHNPIIFDFKQKKFDRIFPFDQSFSIKVKNIADEINLIHLEIYEYNFRKKKFNLGETVLPEDLKNFRIKYVSDPWERSLISGDSGEIIIPYRLKPNQTYTAKLIGEKKAELTDTEKNDLMNILKGDKLIEDFINKISLEYLEKSEILPEYGALDVFQSSFNSIAEKSVKRANSSYRVERLELDRQLSDFANYVNGFSELNNNIEFFNSLVQKENSLDKSIKSQLTSDIEEFEKLLKDLNWGTTTSSDSDFRYLKDFFDNKVIPKITNDNSINEAKNSIDNFFQEFFNLRSQFSALIIEYTITPKTFKVSSLNSTYRADFVKNAKLYITLDLGLSYVWRMDRIITYSGVNIYFRPMNKNIPLRNYKGREWFAVRSSMLIGITLNSVDNENIRKGIFGNSALVLGGGLRLNPFLKINTGTFVYYSNSNNPLISSDQFRTTFSPFISLSIDLDVKPLFSGIGESIFK